MAERTWGDIMRAVQTWPRHMQESPMRMSIDSLVTQTQTRGENVKHPDEFHLMVEWTATTLGETKASLQRR